MNLLKKTRPPEVELITEEQLGKFRASTVESNYFVEFGNQLYVMLRRNTLLQIRWWKSTLAQTLLAPLVFHLLLFILQQADYARQRTSNLYPTSSPLQGIYQCQGRVQSTPCINIMYTPAIEPYNSFMQKFIDLNTARTGVAFVNTTDSQVLGMGLPGKTIDVMPVKDADFIYSYALQHPNTTRWAVVFNQTSNPNAVPSTNIQYQLWYNFTQTANGSDIFGREMLSFMRGQLEA